MGSQSRFAELTLLDFLVYKIDFIDDFLLVEKKKLEENI